MLIVLSGLPGAGKTTIAKELVRRLGAVYVRIDSIEQKVRDCKVADSRLDVAGYTVGYAIAGDNLGLGQTVVADSVNALPVTRNSWRDVARQAQAEILEVEVTCSDRSEHRTRVETRTTDIPGLRLPDWEQVVSREYHPWDRERIVVDTEDHSVAQSVELVLEAIRIRKE
jgi:predicted kinase